MIAVIRFPLHDVPTEAVLDDEGAWSCPDEELTATLNTLIAGANTSPSEGRLYWKHARRMAEMLSGTIEYGAVEDEPAGRIY